MGSKLQKNIAKSANTELGLQNVELTILYGSDDYNKAIVEIPAKTVQSFTLVEGIYESLPYINLIIEDTGNFFHHISFDIGESLYVKILPKLADKDIITYPYLEVKYKITGVKQFVNTKKQSSYKYEILAVYPAEEYLNSTFIWPDDTTEILNPYKKYTSVELLRRVVPKCGLTFCNMTGKITFDEMTWYNYNKTYQEFIEYVMDHAWLGNDDAPMFYITRDGLGCLDSIENMHSKASLATYMNDSLYRNKYANEIADARKTNKTDLPYRRLFNIDFESTNIGYYQNTGAYGAETSVYTPKNQAHPVDPTVLKPVYLKLKEIKYEDVENKKTSSSIPPKPYVGKQSNFSNQVGHKRYRSQEYAFLGNHLYFDIAPLHNNNLVKSFPQVFTYITLDCGKQLAKDATCEMRAELGDKITVDLSTINNSSSSNIGDYIIGGIVHQWTKNANYTQVLCCISDGTQFNHNKFVQEKKNVKKK